jgi:hypothetical protein
MRLPHLALGLVLALAPSAARADVINFLDDGTRTAFAILGPEPTSYSEASEVNGVIATLSAGPEDAYLTWYVDWLGRRDGFGVHGASYEVDEVEGREYFVLAFDQDVWLRRAWITNFFYSEQPTPNITPYNECGWYEVHGSRTTFCQDDWSRVTPVSNGEYDILFGGLFLPAGTQILLGAYGVVTEPLLNGLVQPGHHEWSLAGLEFDVARVPEPATLLLLGLGLLLAARSRRARV